MIKRIWLIPAFLAAAVLGGSVGAYFRTQTSTAGNMREAATNFLATLDDAQKAKAVMPYEAPQRVDWHFIPKDQRKGLQVRDMTEEQRQAAKALLQASLSEAGFQKAMGIMELEKVLQELEKDRQGGPLRDSLRYYVTIFGSPDGDQRWGLSFEGHHLSLNFVVEGDQVVSSTPAVFATNPATMMTSAAGVEKGTRLLEAEEKLAFELLASLDADQRAKAVIADMAPREVRAAGEAQPPQDAAEGITYGELNEDQARLMRQLVESYTRSLPQDVARQRIMAIRDAGPENVYFAWAGPDKPGVGHYYKVQGPSFLIEFVNTQPDAAGNPANHIHCLWRDMRGDFALPAK